MVCRDARGRHGKTRNDERSGVRDFRNRLCPFGMTREDARERFGDEMRFIVLDLETGELRTVRGERVSGLNESREIVGI